MPILVVSRLHLIDPSSIEHNSASYFAIISFISHNFHIFIVALRSSWYVTTNKRLCETLLNHTCQASCKKRRRLLHMEAIEQRGWRSERRMLLEEIWDHIRTTFRTKDIECRWTKSCWLHWNWLKTLRRTVFVYTLHLFELVIVLKLISDCLGFFCVFFVGQYGLFLKTPMVTRLPMSTNPRINKPSRHTYAAFQTAQKSEFPSSYS